MGQKLREQVVLDSTIDALSRALTEAVKQTAAPIAKQPVVVLDFAVAADAKTFLEAHARIWSSREPGDPFVPSPLSVLLERHGELKDEQRKKDEEREARGELVLRDDVERRLWSDAYAAWLPLLTTHTEACMAADSAVRELRKRQ